MFHKKGTTSLRQRGVMQRDLQHVLSMPKKAEASLSKALSHPSTPQKKLESPTLAKQEELTQVLNNRSTVSLGDKGPQVQAIQKMLLDKGYSVGRQGADGIFGEKTQAAVKRYQADQNKAVSNGKPRLLVDGIVGYKTIAELDKPLTSQPYLPGQVVKKALESMSMEAKQERSVIRALQTEDQNIRCEKDEEAFDDQDRYLLTKAAFSSDSVLDPLVKGDLSVLAKKKGTTPLRLRRLVAIPGVDGGFLRVIFATKNPALLDEQYLLINDGGLLEMEFNKTFQRYGFFDKTYKYRLRFRSGVYDLDQLSHYIKGIEYSPTMLEEGLEILIDFTPGAGQVKSLLELATGKDFLSGRELTQLEQALNAAPFLKVLKKAGKVLKKDSPTVFKVGKITSDPKVVVAVTELTASKAKEGLGRVAKFTEDELGKIIKAKGELEHTLISELKLKDLWVDASKRSQRRWEDAKEIVKKMPPEAQEKFLYDMAKKLYKNSKAVFWRRVYKDKEMVQFFIDRGYYFTKAGNAPILNPALLGKTGGMAKRNRRLTIQHVEQMGKGGDPLDPDNLVFRQWFRHFQEDFKLLNRSDYLPTPKSK